MAFIDYSGLFNIFRNHVSGKETLQRNYLTDFLSPRLMGNFLIQARLKEGTVE
jgi:hypothetical protein